MQMQRLLQLVHKSTSNLVRDMNTERAPFGALSFYFRILVCELRLSVIRCSRADARSAPFLESRRSRLKILDKICLYLKCH